MKSKILAVIIVCMLTIAVAYSFYGPMVRATVDTSKAGTCSFDYPIKISITNLTFHRLARVNLELEAWRDGRSINVLSWRYFTFDKTLSPFETATLCFSDAAVSVTGTIKGRSLFDEVVRETEESHRLTQGLEIAIMKVEPEYL